MSPVQFTAEDVKQWRRKLRITQEQAALSIGINRRKVMDWELNRTGIAKPHRLAMLYIADHPECLVLE